MVRCAIGGWRGPTLPRLHRSLRALPCAASPQARHDLSLDAIEAALWRHFREVVHARISATAKLRYPQPPVSEISESQHLLADFFDGVAEPPHELDGYADVPVPGIGDDQPCAGDAGGEVSSQPRAPASGPLFTT